jgi:hypothetical protein
MSTNSDLVASALGDEAKSRQTIADETGLELQAVSQCLSGLHGQGRAKRTAGGWVAGEAKAQRVHGHESSPPAESDTVRASSRRKHRPRPGISIPPTRVAPPTNGRTLEFALSEHGAILVRSCVSNGDWREMPRADAEALALLVAKETA